MIINPYIVTSSGGGTDTITYDSGDNILDSIAGDIPLNWDRFSGSAATRLEIGTSCTSIGSYAFYGRSGYLSSLVIPDSVTSISSYAFGYCSNMTGPLVIPNSVTTIGSLAFFYTGFTTAYLAPPLANVGSNAFLTSGLTTIYAKDAVASGWTLGAGQTVGGQSGVTVNNWDNYPNPIPN